MKTAGTFHLAIDGNEANVAQRVGSNEYAFQLLSAMAEQLRARADIEVTVLLTNKALPDMPRSHKRWQYLVVGPAPLWTQIALPIHLWLNTSRYDVLFTPGHYAPRHSSVPYVSSVMDLAFLEFPRQFRRKDALQLKHWTKYSVKNAQKIVTISQFSKQEIHRFYQLPLSKIVVVHPAVEKWPLPSQSTVRKVLHKWHVSTPYLLYVGTLQPRKNLLTLLDAVELLWSEMPKKQKSELPQQLVIAGKVGWLADKLLERIKNSSFKKRIILTNFISETEKRALISSAEAMIQIGWYEGFGIPALEALHAGVPVIASSTSSLPEVVGKAGFLVLPDSLQAVVEAIKAVASMSNGQRVQFKRLAHQQVNSFDWSKSAEVLIETLEDVAKKTSRSGADK